MAGPSWLPIGFAAVMLITALYCAGRLVAACVWQRPTEVDADTQHVVMGVAMAGMLLPRLSPLPDTTWQVVFAGAVAWFGARAVLAIRGSAPASRWRSAHPLPHLVESAAMGYMLTALPGSWPGGPAGGMAMPGVAGGHVAPGGSLLALAVVLALFMVGYVLWTADQLTSLARAAAVAARAGLPAPADRATGHRVLAPGLAACARIAMGVSMGYMLLATL
jgi:hypothetical protein